MYVAYACEHLRDGEEESAMIFSKKEDAAAWIEKIANGYAGNNHSFRLFEIGKELPILETVQETPQPTVKKRKFRAG